MWWADFSKISDYETSRKSTNYNSSYSRLTDGLTDGQTDMTKLIVDIWNCFAKAPKNGRNPSF
jgi:hypothetical protein